MKSRKLVVILMVLLLFAAIVFASLWVAEKKDHSDLEELCAYAAYQAYSRFSHYREDGSLYDYAYGVAELESVCNCYLKLIVQETGSTDSNYLYLNQLIGALMDYPELTEQQVNMLVTISYQLNQNIHDVNVYDDVFALYNELTR